MGELVLYKNGIINLEIGPIQVDIKRQSVIINFNILPLRQNNIANIINIAIDIADIATDITDIINITGIAD